MLCTTVIDSWWHRWALQFIGALPQSFPFLVQWEGRADGRGRGTGVALRRSDTSRRNRAMEVRVGCEFAFETDVPVPMLMLVRPRPDGDHRVMYESRWTRPDVPIHEYVDSFGNACWRLMAPGGPIAIRYDAIVEITGDPDPTRPETPLV